MAAFGAVDLFSGSNPITGTNLWQTDKDPLNELDEGIEDVIGKQGQNVGMQILQPVQLLLDSLLGIQPNSSNPINLMFTEVYQVMGDFLSVFGLSTWQTGSSSTTPGTPGFNLQNSVLNFVTSMLKPTNLVAMLVPNANNSAGVTGFIPLENLALELIAGVIGGAQEVIDAILGAVGIPPGSGTSAQVNTLFSQLFQMLATPAFGSTFDPTTAVENFVTEMITPTGLLAPLVGGFVPNLNIPPLDTSKITSGVFANSFVPGLTEIWNAVSAAMGGPSSGNTLTSMITALENIPGVNVATTLLASVVPGLDATKIISGQFPQTMVANLTTDLADLESAIASGNVQAVWDAILATVGVPAGSGTQAQTTTYFDQLLSMLGTPNLTSGSFNPVTEVENFITTMLAPTNMLAPLVGGFVPNLNIPPLDTSKITSGVFANSFVPGLAQIWNGVVAAMGGAGSGNTLTNMITALQNIPGGNIVSTLLASVIPGLDATKIVSGVFGTGQIPNLDASKIISGVLSAAQIPGLDATKIITGIFPTSLIPGLDASQIVSGVFGQWQLPLIPVGSVGQTTPNLLANPIYTTASSVAGSAQWIWDGTVSHTAEGSGSVKVNCNGTQLQLLSDPATPCAQGHMLACSVWTQWSGAAGTGPCVQLVLVSYLAGNLVASTVLQTIASPAASSGWQQLSGSYTVPSGVDAVRLEYNVLPAATAGTFWFDDASLTKTQLFPTDFTAGLTGTLNNINTQMIARALQTDVISLVNTLGLGSFASIPASITPITNRLTNIGSTGLFDSAFLGNIANIPLLPAPSIPGLDATKIISGVLALPQIPNITLAKSTDLQGLNDFITNTLVGVIGRYTATTLPQSNSSMASLYDNLNTATTNIQNLRSQQIANTVSGGGINVNVNFAAYPDGPLPNTFTCTYSGSGTSQLGISGGNAGWNPLNNDGNRTGMAVWNQYPTNTDYQIVRGSMAAAPAGSTSGGQPRIGGMARVDSYSNPQNYLWARAYCTGFLTYKADLGYTVAGVDTIVSSGVALTWSMDISVISGANGNPRRYQCYSGTQLVYDQVEPGTNSMLGPGYRYWGCKTEMKTGSGGAGNPGTIASTAVSDNAPPVVLGSTARFTRHSTTNVNYNNTGLTTPAALPANFFDTQDYKSPDMTWDGTSVTINTEGTYLVNIRYKAVNIPSNSKIDGALFINGAIARQLGANFADSYLANSGDGVIGSTLVYVHAGDVLAPGYSSNGAGTLNGETTGTCSYWEIALTNRSMW